jgi:hypothetical protein
VATIGGETGPARAKRHTGAPAPAQTLECAAEVPGFLPGSNVGPLAILNRPRPAHRRGLIPVVAAGVTDRL